MQTNDDERIAELSNELQAMTAAKARLDAIGAKVDGLSKLSPEQAAAIRAEVVVAQERLDRASKGGGKLSRSETVTVRLDPKLRYLAELAARLHRRTLSSYVEWAIKASLDTEAVRPTNLPSLHASDHTIGNEAEFLWDVDDADRFAKLALRYPHLLTHEEQVRWKLIRENGYLWIGSYAGRRKEWTWTVDEDSFIYPRLREHWAAFCRVADTGEGKEALPTWVKTEPTQPPEARSPYGGSPPPARTAPAPRPAPAPPAKTGFDDMDDDIPF